VISRELGPTVVLAVREIRRHLLRSFLTVLGIVIGVAAVVTMVTLGNGATAAVREQISSLGANLLQIRPGQGFGRGGGGPPPAPFKIGDVAALREQVAGIVAVVPMAQASATAVRNAANWATTVYGTTAEYFSAQQWRSPPAACSRRPKSRPARPCASSVPRCVATCFATTTRSASASACAT
jgi:putative ABC transport system permease protein